MKKVFLKVLSIFMLTLFVACGSTPEEEPVEPEAPAEEVVEEQKPEPEPEPEPVAVDNSAVLKSAEDARQAAIDAGAEKDAPELLSNIDALYDSIKADSEANKDVSDSAKDIALRYEALSSFIEAKNTKARIDELGFASENQKKYDDANAVLEETESLFANSEATGSEILEKANSAKSSFNLILFTAFKNEAQNARKNAAEAKRNADSVKAGVSQKKAYTEAVDDFKMGDSLYAMQNPEKALEYYTKSENSLTLLYNDISEKRAAAQAAIDAAKKRVAESEAAALEADQTAPLEEKVEGIEDEETQLLEEDNYANPEDAEIELPETVLDTVIENVEDVTQTDLNLPDGTTIIDSTENAANGVKDDLIDATESAFEEAQ